ncbi:hypothetical protein IL992_21945 [Microbispora sp. NEAU-D428]|uniref:hypothetical protein n=1 Tax=Microbispora sitophila TaxID=2771537 RepID=UPI001867CCE9|nr:hypothetical protein [Microbispora sitophila]MBE3011841.1 hypothetical protein [Microbispora sitophila]
MSFTSTATTISGTPLRVQMAYVAVGGTPPPTPRDLGGFSGAVLRAVIKSQMEDESAALLERVLTEPLDSFVYEAWVAQRADAVRMIREAVVSAESEAHDIDVSLPDRGVLRVEIGDNLSTAFAEAMPDVEAQQVNLNYFLGGVRVTWKRPGLLGITSEFKLNFDAEIALSLGLPRSVLRPTLVLGSFRTLNVTLGGTDVFGAVSLALIELVGQITGAPFVPPGESIIPIPIDSLPGIGHIATTVGAAARYGFLTQEARILTDPDGSASLALVVTHPFDPGPTLYDPNGITAVFAPDAHLGVPATQARPGDRLEFTGSGFPLPGDQLSVAWQDTTSGTVTRSELQWRPADTELVAVETIGAARSVGRPQHFHADRPPTQLRLRLPGP